MTQLRYTAQLVIKQRCTFVPVPFDPDEHWGHKIQHHVRGTINGKDVRGTIEWLDDGRGLVLGPAWRRDRHLEHGDIVEVVLEPEGPQRIELADDIVAAFAECPAAGEFFDSIAQFYRRAYLRYIDATKRRPDERARRLSEVVTLLEAHVKERPKSPKAERSSPAP